MKFTFRHPAMMGLVGGWLTGMVWWVGLMVAFAIKDGHLFDKPFLSAPLVSVPWAVMGLIIGVVDSLFRGYWVVAVSFIGTLVGGAYCIVTSPFDGWLALTMPVYSFIGSLIGLGVGVICGAAWTVGASGGDFS